MIICVCVTYLGYLGYDIYATSLFWGRQLKFVQFCSLLLEEEVKDMESGTDGVTLKVVHKGDQRVDRPCTRKSLASLWPQRTARFSKAYGVIYRP